MSTRLSDEDVERIAEAVARRLRSTDAPRPRRQRTKRVASPEMHERIAKKLGRPR